MRDKPHGPPLDRKTGGPKVEETKEERKGRRQAENARDALLASTIVQMRAQAKSWDEIGRALHEDPNTCRGLLQWAIKQKLGDTPRLAELRAVEMETLRLLQAGLMVKALKGDKDAVREVRGLMERRAKLAGLDMPTKIAPTTPDGTKPAPLGPTFAADKLTKAERAALRKLVEKGARAS